MNFLEVMRVYGEMAAGGVSLVPGSQGIGIHFDPNHRWSGTDAQGASLLALIDSGGNTAKILIAWAERWVAMARPIIEPSHRLAASLMCTNASAENIVWPWQAFAVRIPSGLLSGLGDESKHSMLLAQVLTLPNDFVTVMVSGEPLLEHGRLDMPHMWSCGLQSLGSLGDVGREDDESALRTADKRALRMAERLVIGVAREMSTREDARSPLARLRLEGPLPAHGNNVHKLSRAVAVDCREPVREFVRGVRGSAPSVRTLVRGHWKRQPCGPRAEERKWIHVEPFWRGPEDGPLAVRPHRLDARDLPR